MARLHTTVHVDGVAYGPGDVPADVATQISNPDVWDGDPPAAAAERPSDVPPKGGAGSGKDAWAAYAASKDVEVDEDATRDEIVAALEAAGVPTE